MCACMQCWSVCVPHVYHIIHAHTRAYKAHMPSSHLVLFLYPNFIHAHPHPHSRTQAWLELLVAATYGQLPHLGGWELGLLTNALSTHNHRPNTLWLAQLEASSLPLLERMSPKALALLMRGLGGLGVRPGEEWWGALFAATRGPHALRGYNAWDLGSMLWALGVLDVRPAAAWMAGCVGRCKETLEAQWQEERQSAGGWAVHQAWVGPAHQHSSGALQHAQQQQQEQPLQQLQGADGSHEQQQHAVMQQEPSSSTSAPIVWDTPLSHSSTSLTTTTSAAAVNISKGGRVRDRVRMARAAGRWDANTLADTVWALARLGYSPGDEFMSLFVRHVALVSHRERGSGLLRGAAMQGLMAWGGDGAMDFSFGEVVQAELGAVGAGAGARQRQVHSAQQAGPPLSAPAPGPAHAALEREHQQRGVSSSSLDDAKGTPQLAGMLVGRRPRAAQGAAAPQGQAQAQQQQQGGEVASGGGGGEPGGAGSSVDQSVSSGSSGGAPPVPDFSTLVLQGMTLWAARRLNFPLGQLMKPSKKRTKAGAAAV